PAASPFTGWFDEALPGPATGNGWMVKTAASYVAARTRALRLGESSWLDKRTYRWCAWDQALSILRGAYGPYANRLKLPVLRGRLRQYASPVPTLVDGKIRPVEWVHTGKEVYKTDFEHHNFGGAELDSVDPAYDLASAVFEFQLSEQAEDELLQVYVRERGDATIFERILLYKLLYGAVVVNHAADAVSLCCRAMPNQRASSVALRALE